MIVLDTLNDTVVSRMIYLGLFQRFAPTRVMPAGRYRRERLLTPSALTAACAQAGTTVERIVGYEPGSPVALLTALLARRRGTIADNELGGRAQFKLSKPWLTRGRSPGPSVDHPAGRDIGGGGQVRPNVRRRPVRRWS